MNYFLLADQIKKVVFSISNNVAEGADRYPLSFSGFLKSATARLAKTDVCVC